MARGRRHSAGFDPEKLTAREMDVLMKLLEPRSDWDIAADLQISIHTVKFHKKNIYSKFGVDSREGLISSCRALSILAEIPRKTAVAGQTEQMSGTS